MTIHQQNGQLEDQDWQILEDLARIKLQPRWVVAWFNHGEAVGQMFDKCQEATNLYNAKKGGAEAVRLYDINFRFRDNRALLQEEDAQRLERFARDQFMTVSWEAEP